MTFTSISSCRRAPDGAHHFCSHVSQHGNCVLPQFPSHQCVLILRGLAGSQEGPKRLVGFTKFGADIHTEEGAYQPGDWLLFGARVFTSRPCVPVGRIVGEAVVGLEVVGEPLLCALVSNPLVSLQLVFSASNAPRPSRPSQ